MIDRVGFNSILSDLIYLSLHLLILLHLKKIHYYLMFAVPLATIGRVPYCK